MPLDTHEHMDIVPKFVLDEQHSFVGTGEPLFAGIPKAEFLEMLKECKFPEQVEVTVKKFEQDIDLDEVMSQAKNPCGEIPLVVDTQVLDKLHWGAATQALQEQTFEDILKAAGVEIVEEMQVAGIHPSGHTQEGTHVDFFEQFFEGYKAAMLFAETDEKDQPLDQEYTTADISAEAQAVMLEDCVKFWTKCRQVILNGQSGPNGISPAEGAGYDFWLDRRGHGSGFLDADTMWSEEARQFLHETACSFSDGYVYVNDGVIELG